MNGQKVIQISKSQTLAIMKSLEVLLFTSMGSGYGKWVLIGSINYLLYITIRNSQLMLCEISQDQRETKVGDDHVCKAQNETSSFYEKLE